MENINQTHLGLPMTMGQAMVVPSNFSQNQPETQSVMFIPTIPTQAQIIVPTMTIIEPLLSSQIHIVEQAQPEHHSQPRQQKISSKHPIVIATKSSGNTVSMKPYKEKTNSLSNNVKEIQKEKSLEPDFQVNFPCEDPDVNFIDNYEVNDNADGSSTIKASNKSEQNQQKRGTNENDNNPIFTKKKKKKVLKKTRKMDDNHANDQINKQQSMDANLKTHLRHIMLFYYRKGKKVSQASRKICEVYGENAVADRTVRKWFGRFKNGQFDLTDQERPGRPLRADDERIKSLLFENPRYSTRELSLILGIAKSTVHDHLAKNGYSNRHDLWVPRCLPKDNQESRKKICEQLHQRQMTEPFLHRVIVGGERWISLNNEEKPKPSNRKGRKKKKLLDDQNDDDDNSEESISQIKKEIEDETMVTPSGNKRPRTAMLSVWWDWKGLIHYELFDYQTENSLTVERYCEQLDRLRLYLQEKRSELMTMMTSSDETATSVIYLHDKAKVHKSTKTKEKLLEFKWEELSHPNYSPDLSPSDYHLFRSIQNFVSGKNFQDVDHLHEELNKFFQGQPSSFWEDGIMQLPSRWKKVIERNGAYSKV